MVTTHVTIKQQRTLAIGLEKRIKIFFKNKFFKVSVNVKSVNLTPITYSLSYPVLVKPMFSQSLNEGEGGGESK